MRVTVCELPDDRSTFIQAWEALIKHVKGQKSDLVLLPELPFSAWFARAKKFDVQVWQQAQEEHATMMKKLSVLAPAIVLGTHAVTENGLHLNRGFIWTQGEGYLSVHDKYYFPNEKDFYEQNWFDRSPHNFTVGQIQDVSIGYLICTEVMFNEWARHYGKQGANIIAAPRASTLHERWNIAPRMAAIVSGAFVISSNRVDEQLFAGRGFVINPEGEVLATTSRDKPFATVEIDLAESIAAQKTYPRDVQE